MGFLGNEKKYINTYFQVKFKFLTFWVELLFLNGNSIFSLQIRVGNLFYFLNNFNMKSFLLITKLTNLI